MEWTKKEVLNQVQKDAYRNQSDKDAFFERVSFWARDKTFREYLFDIFDLIADVKELEQNKNKILAHFNKFIKQERIERKEVDRRFEETKIEMRMASIERQALQAAADFDRKVEAYSRREDLFTEFRKLKVENGTN